MITLGQAEDNAQMIEEGRTDSGRDHRRDPSRRPGELIQ